MKRRMVIGVLVAVLLAPLAGMGIEYGVWDAYCAYLAATYGKDSAEYVLVCVGTSATLRTIAARQATR